MLIVLPTLLMRGVYAFYCWLTGKKAPVPAADKNTDKKPEAKGVCPYHVVLRLFGMKIPEKKAPQVEEVVPVKTVQCPYAAKAAKAAQCPYASGAAQVAQGIKAE